MFSVRVSENVGCLFVRSSEEKSLERDQEDAKAAEERGKEHTTSKAASRRAARQQLKEPRTKSPSGKSRSGHRVSATPDVSMTASDADAR